MKIKDQVQLRTELEKNPAEAWRKRARNAKSRLVKEVYEKAALAAEIGNDSCEDPDPTFDDEMHRAEEELRLAQREPTFVEGFILRSRKVLDWLSFKLAPFSEKYAKVINDGWWILSLAIFGVIHFLALHGFAACFLLAAVPLIITFGVGAISIENKYRYHVRLVTCLYLLWATVASVTAFKTTVVSEDYRKSIDCGDDRRGACDVDDHPLEVRGKSKVLYTWVSRNDDSFFDFRLIPATLFTSNTLEWINLQQPEAYKTEDPLVDASNPHKREIYQTVVSYSLKILPYDKSVGVKSGGLKAESELIQKQIVANLKTLKISQNEILPSEKVYQEIVAKVKNPFFQLVNIQAMRKKISIEFLEEGDWWEMIKKSPITPEKKN